MRSYDASTRTDLPIPYDTVAELVTHLRRRTSRFVLIGAVARDLLASCAGGLPIARATRDIDIAVAVATARTLDDLGELRPTRAQPRYTFRGASVDVVPFGAIERNRHVTFSNDFELDVTGVAEACENAVRVTLPGGVTVPVASLESQTVLKLLAWRDRGTPYNNKDALDLGTVFEASASGTYGNELWEDPAMTLHEYDAPLAGAYRLGRDAALTLDGHAQLAVAAVITPEEEQQRLARAMQRFEGRDLVRAYLRGFVMGTSA